MSSRRGANTRSVLVETPRTSHTLLDATKTSIITLTKKLSIDMCHPKSNPDTDNGGYEYVEPSDESELCEIDVKLG